MQDGAYNPERNVAPKPGDVSICIHCATVAEFDDDLGIRYMDPARLDEVLADPKVRRVLDALRSVREGPR